MDRSPQMQETVDRFRQILQPIAQAEPERQTEFVRFEIYALQGIGLLKTFDDLVDAKNYACFEKDGNCDLFGVEPDRTKVELCIFCGSRLNGRDCPKCEAD